MTDKEEKGVTRKQKESYLQLKIFSTKVYIIDKQSVPGEKKEKKR